MNKWTYPSITSTMTKTLLIFLMMTIITSTYLIKKDQTTIMEWEFTSMNSIHMNIPILLETKTMIFGSTVMMISFSVMMFSTTYMANNKNLKYFTIMIMLFVTSMMMLIFIPHIIMMMIGWDGLGVTSYLLVIFYMNKNSLSAGMITVMTNRLGDAFLILSSAWMFTSMHWHLNLTSTMTMFATINLITAAMTKSAQLPFSAWLPAAMAAPTPVSALVHSSTLVTAGIYLMLRFYPSLSDHYYFSEVTFVTGTLTCLMAGMSATQETDFKKIIALSTLSQLGIMMMTIGMNQTNLTFLHLIAHAMFKALLFICAGTIMHNNLNNQDIRQMGNIYLSMPTISTTLNTANLSLCGMPMMTGFYSKDMIIESLMSSNKTIIISMTMMFSIWLTAFYSIRMSLYTLWSPFKGQKMNMLSNKSKPTLTACSMLLITTITGGALLLWTMNPQMQMPTMPVQMKTLTMTLTTIMMMITYMVWKENKPIKMTEQMTSMWFLKYISSYPINKQTSKMMTNLTYNESTWMEMNSGKGMEEKMNKLAKEMQYTTNTNLSQLMSTTTLMMVMTITLLMSYQ
nr:NADH dehydrogenase subunit 5 [Cupuladria biporosa]